MDSPLQKREGKAEGQLARWRQRARELKRDTYAIYLACRDPRVPWSAKALGAFVVAYAFSPIDLIPDFIPVLGYLDDLILVPLGIALVLKRIPPNVMEDCRQQAREALEGGGQKPKNWLAAGLIVVVWLAVLWFAGQAVWKVLPHDTAHVVAK